MSKFPHVTIEVQGGVAELTERSAGVGVTIIDYGNDEGDGPSRDFFPALWDRKDYWMLQYRGGEMTAFVPREIAATEIDAIDRVKQEHPSVIMVAHGWYTHGDMWEATEA